MNRSTTFLLYTLCILFCCTSLQAESMNSLIELKNHASEWLSNLPVLAFFIAFCILPSFGFPISLFYLIAPVYGMQTALCIILPGICVNQLVGYYTARKLLNPVIGKILSRSKFNVPELSDENEKKIICAIRICGMPYSFQNWILGLAKASIFPYIYLSWLLQVAFALAFIYLGDAFFSGRGGQALSAILLILVLVMIFSIFRKRQKQKLN